MAVNFTADISQIMAPTHTRCGDKSFKCAINYIVAALEVSWRAAETGAALGALVVALIT